MPQVLVNFFRSRKFWAFLTGFVTVLFASYQDGILSYEELRNLTMLVIGYVASIALEDGMTNWNSVNWNSVNWNNILEQLQQGTQLKTDVTKTTTMTVEKEE